MGKKKKKNKILPIVFIFIVIFLVSFSASAVLEKLNNKSTDKKTNVTEDINKPTQNSNSNPQPAVNVKDNKVDVVLSCAGDCTIGTDPNFNESTSLPAMVKKMNNDYSYLFKNAAPIFKADDITTVNLETTFTNATVRANKEFTFKSPPEFAQALNLGYIEGVNISNNHIHDFLDKGFNDTINTLKQYKINYFGEGNKWITEVKGVKFGFLGYQGWSDDTAFLNKVKKDILQLKSENCVVIINFHWGIEGQYYPNDVQKHIAHFAIDNGADLIIGHHPHVIEGIEKYKDKYICYSLGNFCFGGNSNPGDKDTFIFQGKFSFNNNKLTNCAIRVIPFSISSVSYKNDYCPTPLQGDQKLQLINKINKLSFNLGFKVDENFK